MNRAQRRREAKRVRRQREPDHATLVRDTDTGRAFIVGRATGLGDRLVEGLYARAANQYLSAHRAIQDAQAELLARPDL